MTTHRGPDQHNQQNFSEENPGQNQRQPSQQDEGQEKKKAPGKVSDEEE